MKKVLFLGMLLLTGCATLDMNMLDWIPSGPEFSPTDPDKIEIVSSTQDIKRTYGVLGLLRVKDLKEDHESVRLGVEKGRKFIASKGADAMMLGQYNSASDGVPNPRITLIIYAIKYKDTLTEKDKKALEDFEVLGILNESAANR